MIAAHESIGIEAERTVAHAREHLAEMRGVAARPSAGLTTAWGADIVHEVKGGTPLRGSRNVLAVSSVQKSILVLQR